MEIAAPGGSAAGHASFAEQAGFRGQVAVRVLTGVVPIHVAFVQLVLHSPASLLNFVPAGAGEHLCVVQPVGFDCDDVPLWRHVGRLPLFSVVALPEFVGLDRHLRVGYAGFEGETGRGSHPPWRVAPAQQGLAREVSPVEVEAEPQKHSVGQCCANLDGARIADANLTGTDLTATRPWRADLFRQDSPMPTLGKPTLTSVSCVADLTAIWLEMRQRSGDAIPAFRLYYRGEPKRWKLRPSVVRQSSHRKEEGRMLLEMMTRRPEDFSSMESTLSHRLFMIICQFPAMRPSWLREIVGGPPARSAAT